MFCSTQKERLTTSPFLFNSQYTLLNGSDRSDPRFCFWLTVPESFLGKKGGSYGKMDYSKCVAVCREVIYTEEVKKKRICMILHPMPSANLNRIFSKLFVLVWVIYAFVFLSQMNLSGIAFLFHLQPPAPIQPSYGLAIAELIRAILFGWMVFTVFLKPRAKSILPNKSIKRDFSTLSAVVSKGAFIELWGILIFDVGRRVDRVNQQPALPNWGLVMIGLVLSVWTIYKVLQWRRKKQLERSKLESIPDLSIPAIALNKIRENLNENEQDELKLLLFEDLSISNVSVQNIAWTAFRFLGSAIVAAVAEEFLTRF